MARFDLSDAEWAIIAPLLPNKPRGVPRTDDRRVLNGIFSILRTGSPCRGATARTRRCIVALTGGRRWASGSMFSGPCPSRPRSPWPSQTARSSAPTSTPQPEKRGPDHATGLPRGGLSTQLHAVVAERGLPTRLALSQGQASDEGGRASSSPARQKPAMSWPTAALTRVLWSNAASANSSDSDNAPPGSTSSQETSSQPTRWHQKVSESEPVSPGSRSNSFGPCVATFIACMQFIQFIIKVIFDVSNRRNNPRKQSLSHIVEKDDVSFHLP